MSTFEELCEADLEIREESASRAVYYGMLVVSGLGLAAAAALAAQELPQRWHSVVAISIAFAVGALLYQWVQRASGVLGSQRDLCVFMAFGSWLAPCVSALVVGAFMAGIPDTGAGILFKLLLVALVRPYFWGGAIGAVVLGRAALRRLYRYEVSGGNGGPATLMLTVIPMLAILMPLAGAWEKGMRRQREVEAIAAAQAAEQVAAEAAERRGQGRPGEAELSREARQAADPNAGLDVRRIAVRDLATAYEAEKATDDLLWLLNDPEVRDQIGVEVCQRLSDIATPRAKQVLLDTITRLPEQADAAAGYLVSSGCFECIPELISLLDGPARLAVARALGDLGAWEAVPALIGTLERESDDEVRGWMVRSLADIGGPQASRAVLRAVKKFHGRLGGRDEEELVRLAKERAHLGPPRRTLYDLE